MDAHGRELVTVGLDDSDASWTALLWAAQRAGQHPCRLRVVRVADRGEDAAAHARGRLQHALDFLQRTVPGTPVDTEVAHRGVPRALARAAADQGVLVIGSHRQRRLQSALTGLLPDRIAGQTAVPTVIVPDDWSSDDDDDGGVVLAVASDTADNAIAVAAAEAGRRGATLHVVHAWRIPAPIGPAAVAVMQEDPAVFEGTARGVLDAAVARVTAATPDLAVQALLVNTDPATAVCDLAQGKALIVIGRHHRTALGGEFLSSLGQEIVAGSRTPLCVVSDRVRQMASAAVR